MALPASGTLALTTIATEFGDSAPHSMSEFYRGGGLVPDSAGNSAVAASGALNIGGFYNAANRVAIALSIASSTQNYDLYTNRGGSYSAGTSDITLTINAGVNVGSASTGTYALSIPSAFHAGDSISIVNNGVIIGRGGNGGKSNGAPTNVGTGGGAGNAVYVAKATTITNNGTIASGGGGGGGGGPGAVFTYTPKGQTPATYYGGGGGGGGAGYTAGSGSPGQTQQGGTGATGASGSVSAGGNGGAGSTNSGAGGAGGGRGANGSGGGSGSWPIYPYPFGAPYIQGGAAGAKGSYLVGNPLVTWAVTGTRQGNVS